MSLPQGNVRSKALGYFVAEEDTTSNNSARYLTVAGSRTDVTESNVNMLLPKRIRLLRIEILVVTNTKDEDVDFSFRDDGVSVATLTVTAGQIGLKSKNVDVIVNADSLVNLLRDTSASSSGNLKYKPIVYWYK